jgi:hypothetical protein
MTLKPRLLGQVREDRIEIFSWELRMSHAVQRVRLQNLETKISYWPPCCQFAYPTPPRVTTFWKSLMAQCLFTGEASSTLREWRRSRVRSARGESAILRPASPILTQGTGSFAR